jgi:hypothetical protein
MPTSRIVLCTSSSGNEQPSIEKAKSHTLGKLNDFMEGKTKEDLDTLIKSGAHTNKGGTKIYAAVINK